MVLRVGEITLFQVIRVVFYLKTKGSVNGIRQDTCLRVAPFEPVMHTLFPHQTGFAMQSKKAKKNTPSVLEIQTLSSSEDNCEVSPRHSFRKDSEQKRRMMLNQYFDEVVTLLTMMGEKSTSKKVDKATILQEAANFVGLYFDLASVLTPSSLIQSGESTKATGGGEGKTVQSSVLENGGILHLLLNAMDAFMMIVSESGRIFYCTELITSLLGHMQSRLVGQNLFDYILEHEAPLLKEQFKPLGDSPCKDLPECPIICYPCREFQCNLKVYSGETGLFPQHHLFQCLSYLRVWKKTTSPDPPSSGEAEVCMSRDPNVQSCILLIAKLPTSPSVVDLPISTNEVNFQFDMRVSREGKIIDVEKQAILVLGYPPSELMGSSFFDYIDPYQLTHLAESIGVIFNKGLGTTTPSRMRSKNGRYLWIISKGYVSYNPWNHKPDHVLLSTRVLGCDQVLSEHKFYRDFKMVPNFHSTEEWYCTEAFPQMKPAFSSSDTDLSKCLASSHQLHPSLVARDTSTISVGTNTSDDTLAMSESLKDVRRELSLKNQELFNLQCRFLEQQQLLEKERNQFYQVTRQVMQCISCPQNVQVAGTQPPLDMMPFETSAKMTAMPGYSQDYSYVVDHGASLSNEFMEPLPEAMLPYQQGRELMGNPHSGGVLELSSSSMPLSSSKPQNNYYMSSTSYKQQSSTHMHAPLLPSQSVSHPPPPS